MRLQPLFDRVILRHVADDSAARAGILVSAEGELQPVLAVVVALGLGKVLDNGEYFMPTVSLGDHILLEPGEGIEFEIDGERLVAAKEKDIICIVKT
jgi:chaperonin GroES